MKAARRVFCTALILLMAVWVTSVAAQEPAAEKPTPKSVYDEPEDTTETASAGDKKEQANSAEKSREAEAPPPENATEAAEKQERLQRAKRLFRQGNAMRQAGDFTAALSFYLKSRGAVASVANTLNAAVCLNELRRFDEALDLYEVLLTEFGAELTKDERESIAPEMAKLRSKVGSIDVSSNVAGTLVVDSRARGKLPLLRPVRVTPGVHRITVLADGYLTFQSEVTVKARQTSAVRALLEPLAERGTLRVAKPALTGAQIFVDGAAVGVVPWEGALAPGQHLFSLQRVNEGSAPQEVTVVVNQVVDVDVELLPLGPEIELRATPSTADLVLDEVPIGTGRWRGRLPIGAHLLEVSENGYFTGTHPFEITATTGVNVRLKLKTDEDHPRWGISEPGLFWGEVIGGYATASSLGSGAEAACDAGVCTNNESATGWLVGAQIGYELPIRVGLHLDAGYLTLSKTLDRTYDSEFTTSAGDVQTRYDLHEEIKVRGPFAGGGVSYRLPVTERFELQSHVTVGAFIARVTDPVDGTVTSEDETAANVAVPGSEYDSRGINLFVMPSISARFEYQGFRAGVGIAVALFTLKGPLRSADGTGALLTDSELCQSNLPSHASCAPSTTLIAEENGYGGFAMWLPHAILGYAY